MDISDSIVPRSDQTNAEDFLTGPRTVTIADVKKGSAEQPVDIFLTEFPGRPFRPSKTVRRLLVAAWGPEASAYVGRRMTLYRDPSVRFGGADVGGIRVSHMSNLDKPLTVSLTVTRGKRQPYTVKPLPAPAPPKTSGVEESTTSAGAPQRGDVAAVTDDTVFVASGSDAHPSTPEPAPVHRNRIPAGWTGPLLSDEGATKRMWGLLRDRFGEDEPAARDFMHEQVTRAWESSKELEQYEVLTIILALTNGDAA